MKEIEVQVRVNHMKPKVNTSSLLIDKGCKTETCITNKVVF